LSQESVAHFAKNKVQFGKKIFSNQKLVRKWAWREESVGTITDTLSSIAQSIKKLASSYRSSQPYTMLKYNLLGWT